MTQDPDPQKMQDAVRNIAGMMTQAHVAAMVALGVKLGLYPALSGAGAVTSAELAEKTGLHERWLREWLRGQAAGGVIEYYGDDRFELSAEIATLLANPDAPIYLGGNFAALPRHMASIKPLQESFRTGLGASWTDRDEEAVAGAEDLFKIWYKQQLVPVGLPALDGVVAKLEAGAKVADVGCGAGVALIEMAKAFPSSEYHGYDISIRSLERAKNNATEAAVSNVTFHNVADEQLPSEPTFDLISTFDCLHDMTHPSEVVKEIRAAIKPDGTWLIADINCAPTFEENLDLAIAPLLYSLSVLSCLSSGMSAPDAEGLGNTGLPEPKMRELVQSAGFTQFRKLDIAHPINAFYEARV